MVEINSRIMIDPEQCGDGRPMKAIKLVGDIDDRHRLLAEVPKELPAGPVRLIVLLPEEDDSGALWAAGNGPRVVRRAEGPQPGYIHLGGWAARELGTADFTVN